MKMKKEFPCFFVKIKKFIPNVILGLIVAACLFGIDVAHHLYHFHLHDEHVNFFTKFFDLLILLAITMSFLFKNRNFLIVCGVIIGALFIQLLYFSYFGVPIAPMDIALFFTNKLEIIQALSSMVEMIWFPILICGLAFILIFFANKKLNQRQRWKYAWMILILELCFPLTEIIKIAYYHQGARIHSNISVGDYPSLSDTLWESTLKTLLYYFSYTLPHQLFLKNNLIQDIPPPPTVQTSQKNLNIILIMGESLTYKHMSSYHYFRATTPFLDSLKNRSNVVFKQGISAGVCTDISLAMFFNGVRQPDGTAEIASARWNLFKMAKNNGFETYFISAQGSAFLNIIKGYLSPKFIDHYADAGFFGAPSKKSVFDSKLPEYLKATDFENPVFMVLHQRGSHFPYIERYPEEFNIFSSKTGNFQQKQVDSYDNSVRFTDALIASISRTLSQKTHRPTILIFTSDHGESLGEEGIYGHNHLRISDQFHVPIVFIALNGAKLDFLKEKDREDINPQYMSHFELSRIIACLLGYRIPYFSTQKNMGYYVDGNALTGMAGFNKIDFTTDGKLINHYT